MTASRAFVTSGAEYSGCAWSTYSRAPLVRMTFAAPTTGAGVGAEALGPAAGVVLVRRVGARAVYVPPPPAVKDVSPSPGACGGGGVAAAGEPPAECARRELAEELGVRGVEPVPL